MNIYSDGACSGNPGVGGWGYAIVNNEGKLIKEEMGHEDYTTNNRMELIGAISGLKEGVLLDSAITLFTDSAYICNCINQKWYVKWRSNGWVNSKREPVANQDLWEDLLNLLENHNITIQKVKGHAGNEWNERADQLAVLGKIK